MICFCGVDLVTSVTVVVVVVVVRSFVRSFFRWSLFVVVRSSPRRPRGLVLFLDDRSLCHHNEDGDSDHARTRTSCA